MLPKHLNLPFTMMPSLVHRASHSSMLEETPKTSTDQRPAAAAAPAPPAGGGTHLCEVSTTERPVLMMSRIRFQRNLRALGSIPVVGSSCTSPQEQPLS